MCLTFTVAYFAFVLVCVVTITEGSIDSSSLLVRLRRQIKSVIKLVARPLKPVASKLLKPSVKILRRKLAAGPEHDLLEHIEVSTSQPSSEVTHNDHELHIPLKYNVSRLIDRSSSVVLAQIRHNCSRQGADCPIDNEWAEIKELITKVIIDHLQDEIHMRAIDWE